MKEVKSALTSVLDTDAKRLVYQKSDGTLGTVELARLSGLASNSTVADMWDVWLRMGLGESIPVRGGSRFKHTFDIEEFGIKVPEAKTENVQKKAKDQPTEQKLEAPK